MGYKSDLQSNNAELEEILAAVIALPEAGGTVLYTKQTLTEEQKAQARENISGASMADVERMKAQQPYLFAEYQTGTLFDPSTMIDGERVSGNGSFSALASACRTDYIDISTAQGTHLCMFAINTLDIQYQRCYYRMGFYDEEKRFISIHEGNDSSDMTGAYVEIPTGAKYAVVSYITKNEDYVYICVRGSADLPIQIYSYNPFKKVTVPDDLNEKLAVLDDITQSKHQDDSEFTITALNGSNQFSQNDITFVGDELWMSKENATYYTNGTMIFRYRVINGEFTLVGTCDCDFGHLNTMDYCAANDCLIFGNGGNGTETTGNYFVVVKNPRSLGSTALIANVGIKYNVNIGYKVQALWGDSNLGDNNIVYLLSNDSAKITKVLLLKDDNGDFNGGMVTLESHDVDAWGVQGADIFGDTLYIGGQVNGNEYAAVKEISLSDFATTRIVKRKFYAKDGASITACVQGVYVNKDAVWISVNSGDTTKPVCLTKYNR